MKWFKHETKRKAAFKRLIMEYGLEGYGLYWLCVELIAGDITIDNLTFELEDDAELIAHEFKLDTIRVEKIMHRCIELGLFDLADSGRIRCLKLAKLLDESISKNQSVREIRDKITFKIEKHNNNIQKPTFVDIQERLQTPSDQKRIEEKRIEERREEKKEDDDKTFSCTYFDIPKEKIEEYGLVYKDIDIPHELAKMKLWLDDNPGKRKKDYKRFVGNWLSRANADMRSKNNVKHEDEWYYVGDKDERGWFKCMNSNKEIKYFEREADYL